MEVPIPDEPSADTPAALPAVPTAAIPGPGTGDDADASGGGAVAAPPASGGTPSVALTGGQISRVPVGAAATGGGSTAGVEDTWMLLTGLMLLMAGGSAGVVRQRVQRNG